MSTRKCWFRPYSSVAAALVLGLALPLAAGAQEGRTFTACYVPDVGAVYLIQEEGLPAACLAASHVEVSWSEGGGVTDHGALDGLAEDDHPQYLLAEGVRETTNGFAVTGAFETGTIPIEGAGTRLVWYPGKAALRAGEVGSSTSSDATEWDDVNVGDHSVGLGKDVTASGSAAVAMGARTTASGGGSVAVGNGAAASSGNAVALGNGASASAFNAVALGAAGASGLGSVALGRGGASGSFATATGTNTSASGNQSTAMGNGATAGGLNSTAMGLDTEASGDQSTAMGERTTASGVGSTAMGIGTTASGDRSTAMGSDTEASGKSSTAMGGSTVASGVESTAMGIGTTASGISSVAMGHRATTNEKDGAFVYGDRSTAFLLTASRNNQFAVRAQHFWLGSSASVGTDDNFLDTSTGAFLSTGGAWTDASSRAWKEDFRPVEPEAVLEKVVRLPVTEWSYRAEPDEVRHLGPVAEDFHALFGLGSSSRHLAPLDVAGVELIAIQALEDRTTRLHERAARLQSRASALEAENSKLRAETEALRADYRRLLRRLERVERRLGTLEREGEPSSSRRRR